MTVTDDCLMSAKHDDNVSPYLRRPLRSLVEYLKEAAQRRSHEQDRRDQATKNATRPPREDASRDEEA